MLFAFCFSLLACCLLLWFSACCFLPVASCFLLSPFCFLFHASSFFAVSLLLPVSRCLRSPVCSLLSDFSFLFLVDCTEPQDRCYLRLLFFACSCLVLAVFHHVSHCFINSSGDQNPPCLEQTGAFRNNAWRKQSVVFRKVS